MKSLKYILLSSLAFFGIAGLVVLNSCKQDPCNELACKNGGTCSNGYCHCPAGYEGAECEIMSADRFLGTYAGLTRCGIYPAIADTVRITKVKDPDIVNVKGGFGRTSLLGFDATARTPDLLFTDYEDSVVRIHPSATVDNNTLTIYTETWNKQTGSRETCTYIGVRISQ